MKVRSRSSSTPIRHSKPSVRPALSRDAAKLADLNGQLGYPSTIAEVKRRLRSLKPASEHAVFVAEAPSGMIIGWIHVSIEPLLEVDLRAEVNGLVVDEAHRSTGAGWLLLQAAEKWAKKRGCRAMSVRSNVIRERAHGFYLQHGYEHYKTQKAFRKPL